MLKLVDKDIKTIIITVFHTLKKLKNIEYIETGKVYRPKLNF